MDVVRLGKRLTDTAKKYKYALLVLLLGIALMLIPFNAGETKESAPIQAVQQRPDLSEQLSKILSQIQGAGKVQVMLTLAKGEETVYQTDMESSGGENATSRVTTVILTDGERAQYGLVRQVIGPTYLGAVVLCQGADNAAVKLAVVDAVSDLTGITSDRISVLKMK